MLWQNLCLPICFSMCVSISMERLAPGELKGKRIGLLAYGNVASEVARIAHGFGMDVHAYDFFHRVERIESDGVYAEHNLYDLVQCCDIVSFHTPATPRTIGFVNREMIELMKPGGILINTLAKKSSMKTSYSNCLRNAPTLASSPTFPPSVMKTSKRLMGDKYFAPPKKMGAQTAEANANAGLAAAQQIVKFFATGDKTFQVNV